MAPSCEEQLMCLFNELPNASNKLEILRKIKEVLCTFSIEYLKGFSSRFPLCVIFDCVDLEGREAIESTCQILSKLLSSASIDILFSRHCNIVRCLAHRNRLVRETIIHQLSGCIERSTDDDLLIQLRGNAGLFKCIVRSIGDEQLSVATNALKIVAKIGSLRVSDSRHPLFSSADIMVIIGDELMPKNDTVRFRVHEMVVVISISSQDALKRCVDSGLLSKLIKEFDNDDVLTQLNCLELLSRLAMMQHGLVYLNDSGCIKKMEILLQRINDNGGDVSTNFLMPGLIRFFGHVAHLQPKMICSSYKQFMNMMFGLLENSHDNTLRNIVIDTIAIIGSTVDGKNSLRNEGDSMNRCLRVLGKDASGGPHETRSKALLCIYTLIDLQLEDQSTEALTMTENWFRQIKDSFVRLILDSCKLPFPEVRLANFLVIQALCRQLWGQRLLKNSAGFVEYLMDRSTEPDKEGKESRYEIVKVLVESPTALSVFGSDTMVQLEHFYNEGPYYVATRTEVAIEEGGRS